VGALSSVDGHDRDRALGGVSTATIRYYSRLHRSSTDVLLPVGELEVGLDRDRAPPSDVFDAVQAL
jgi:regulatory protein YycI of two-component signal transduction system YycFG